MAMPNHLVFIRHGESEANIVQKHDDHEIDPEITRELFLRPDWRHRLTANGVEQAKNAGEWIRRNLGGVASFDALYVSPYMRTRETAAYLGGPDQGEWTIDDRLVERSWGVYGKMSRTEQGIHFPRTAEEKKLNPWYASLDGGESNFRVYERSRSFQETLHREQAGRKVLVVTHGDYMNASRYGIERLTPEEWEELDEDEQYRLRNCTLLEYSRINPEDPEDIREKIHWRRYTYPDAPYVIQAGDGEKLIESPDGGRWVELSERRRYFGSELLRQAEKSPRLIETNHE